MHAMVHISRTPVAALTDDPNFPMLLEQYAAESAIDGMPSPSAQMDHYQVLESTGAFHAIAAYVDGALVGFLSLLVTRLPHYGAVVATTESFFVTQPARSYGLGMRLLHFAEDYAKALGAVGILVSAPHGGTLERVLGLSKRYRQTNAVFFRSLA